MTNAEVVMLFVVVVLAVGVQVILALIGFPPACWLAEKVIEIAACRP